MVALIVSVIGCSSSLEEYSPDQVINNALTKKDNVQSYYAESKFTTMEQGKVTESITLKEWVSQDGKRRTETSSQNESENSIAVNNGTSLTMYMPVEKKAFIFEMEELAELNQQSPREQAENMLKFIQDTHDIDIIGEDEIAGRMTFILEAKAKKDHDLIGDQQIWIDKENWMILKMTSSSADTSFEWEYTKIEFNPKVSDELFIIDLPDDTTIENFETMIEPEEITLREAKRKLGKPFLHFTETNELKTSFVGLTDIGGEHKQITIDYEREGLSFLKLSIVETPEEDEELPEGLMNEETITVRGQNGIWMEELRLLNWSEEGMTYSLHVLDPNLKLDELLALLENMVHFN